MSKKYEQIKNIFSDILDTEPLKEISIKNYDRKIDYIRDVYNHITKDKYADMKKDAIQFLGISHSQLDDFLIEIICSNLYCDLALILQIVGDKGKRESDFLTDRGISRYESKRSLDRNKKRVSPDRVNKGLFKITLLNEEKFYYYVPTLADVYIETLFIKKDKGFNISNSFIDIYKTLLFDTEEQKNDDVRKKNIRIIKSYRLWDFTTDTLEQVSDIYHEVLFGESKYKYAELNFVEKLFGLLTLNSVISKKIPKVNLPDVVEGISKLRLLGYSSMTEFILNKLNNKNLGAFTDFIDEFIYPLCSECIITILSELIKYIRTLQSTARPEYVCLLLKACQNNIKYKVCDNLKNTLNREPELMLQLFRVLHYLPETNDKEELKEYMIYLFSYYGDEQTTTDRSNNACLKARIKYKDISYLKRKNKADNYEDFTNDEIEKYYREDKSF